MRWRINTIITILCSKFKENMNMLMLILTVKICFVCVIKTAVTQDISGKLHSRDSAKTIHNERQSIDNINNYALTAQNQEAACNETQSCRNGGSCLRHACLCLPGTSGRLCEIVDDCQRQRICKEDEDTSCEYSVEEQKAFCHCRIMEYRFDDATKTCRSCLCTPTFSQILGSFSYCEYKQGQRICTCTEGYAYDPDEGICKRCKCGPNSKWCEFDKKGDVVCVCEEGYAQYFQSCRECSCGPGRCNFFGRYGDCECDSGYEEYKRKCVECKCGKYGKCIFNENGTQTGCKCSPGYAEKQGKCEMCQCGEKSNCSFFGKTKVCECQDGFENVNGFCTDINECEKYDPCNATTRCVNTLGSYKCICDKGYKRNHETLLCDDIDECQFSSPCSQPHTECVNTVGSFKCVCESDFVTRGGSDSDTFCEPTSSKSIYTVSFAVFIVVFVTAFAVILHQKMGLRRSNAVT